MELNGPKPVRRLTPDTSLTPRSGARAPVAGSGVATDETSREPAVE
jgi:hypothetical protein